MSKALKRKAVAAMAFERDPKMFKSNLKKNKLTFWNQVNLGKDFHTLAEGGTFTFLMASSWTSLQFQYKRSTETMEVLQRTSLKHRS